MMDPGLIACFSEHWLRSPNPLRRIVAAREIGRAIIVEACECGKFSAEEIEFIVGPDTRTLINRAADGDSEAIDLLETLFTPTTSPAG